MIQEKSGFWDSIDATPGNSGDERAYTAAEMTIPFEHLVTNGVQSGGTALQVSPGSYDYSTQIAPGMAWIKGRWYLLADDGTGGAAVRVLLHDAPSQYPRIDRVVLRYNANYTLPGRKIAAAIVKGTESASPVAPALTRTGEIYELCLAQVTLHPGQPHILTGDIADTRFDGSLCGVAEFAPQPDLQPRIDEIITDLQEYIDSVLASGGLPASQVSATPPSGQATWTTAQLYLTGLKALVDGLQTSKAAATDVTALQNINTVRVTAGTAPSYAVTDATVTGYAAGLRRTVQFHADGTPATLNFNSLGAKSLYSATGKAANVKAGQIATVYYDGTNFFIVNGGGGLTLPDSPAAGDTVIYVKLDAVEFDGVTTYTPAGTGWGITARKSGTYRVYYCVGTDRGNSNGFTKLQRNGVDVSGSEIYTQFGIVKKIIDISLTAGDTLRLYYKSSNAGYGNGTTTAFFTVSMLAADLQTELNNYATAL